MTSSPNFLLFNSFFNKIYIWPLRDLNSSLDPGVGAINPGAEVTRLGATDLGVEVPDRAQKKILRVWYLGARIYGAELDAAAMYRLQILRPSEEREVGPRTKTTFSGGRPDACGTRHMRAQPRWAALNRCCCGTCTS